MSEVLAIRWDEETLKNSTSRTNKFYTKRTKIIRRDLRRYYKLIEHHKNNLLFDKRCFLILYEIYKPLIENNQDIEFLTNIRMMSHFCKERLTNRNDKLKGMIDHTFDQKSFIDNLKKLGISDRIFLYDTMERYHFYSNILPDWNEIPELIDLLDKIK